MTSGLCIADWYSDCLLGAHFSNMAASVGSLRLPSLSSARAILEHFCSDITFLRDFVSLDSLRANVMNKQH